ncbi:MAG: hypothetical protein ACLPXB_17850 [Thiobacillaceae bacterium]
MTKFQLGWIAAATIALASVIAQSPDVNARGFHGGGGFQAHSEFHGGGVRAGGFSHGVGFAPSGIFRGGAHPRGRFYSGGFNEHRGFGRYHHFRGQLGLFLGAPIYWGLDYYGSYPSGFGDYPPATLVSGYYYYCANPSGYYPEVTYCPSGWLEFAASPPPGD